VNTIPKTLTTDWTGKQITSAALTIIAAGFLLRLYLAWGTFLNPDEALHFFIANRDSWSSTYRASLTMAHPPLLIFLLYWWRNFGTSEILLRLPSVLLGTAFCWVFFRWLNRLSGPAVALTGLLFVALIAPMALLSAEVRQYELLLFFGMSATYLLELALDQNSPTLMLLSASSLYLAMLSHYSALLWVATLGVYGLMRLMQRRNSRGLLTAWLASQLGALALTVFLYVTHVSKIKKTTMAEQAFDSWLYKSYFHAGHDNPIVFLLARTFSVFQFMLGQSVVGDIAALLFMAGIVFLWRRKTALRPSGVTSRQLAVLLTLPFIVNCVAAFRDAYPYGGTRHSVFLVVFGLAGVSICLVRVAGGNIVRSLAIALGMILVCWGFRSVRHPYIDRIDQNRAQMERALTFVQNKIPASEIIFVDYESGLELGHYLCAQRPIAYDGSIPGFLVFNCGGHRFVSTINDLWAFDRQMFSDQWRQLVANAGMKPGDQVWVAQAGWIVTLADELKKDDPAFRTVNVSSFGKNIQFFPVTVGTPFLSTRGGFKPSAGTASSSGVAWPFALVTTPKLPL
jgi:hypothetical protein